MIYLYLHIVFSCVTVIIVLQQGSKVVTAPTAKIFLIAFFALVNYIL